MAYSLSNPHPIMQFYLDWLNTGQITEEAIQVFDNNETWHNYTLMIENILMETDTENLQTVLLTHISFVNTLVAKQPRLVGFLAGQINKFKSSLENVGNRLSADSFSIGVGVPFGISVSLTYNLPPHIMARNQQTP